MMITTSDGDIKKSDAFIFNDLNENELKHNNLLKKETEGTNTGDGVMDNETFNFKFEDGMYLTNFAYTPSSRVGNQLLFKGILDGNGNYRGHNCIVRTNRPGTKESWQGYMEVRKKLQSIREIFLANGYPDTFHVPKSALANMDRAALPSRIASKLSIYNTWREPRKDDWVFVDLYRFPRKETIRTGPMFSAISHISLEQSNGQSYLTNFRAFDYNRGLICITDADISTNIESFERWHTCTKLCEMEIPQNRSEPISIQNNHPELTYRSSAPAFGDIHFWTREPMPILPPYSEHPPEYPPPSAPPILDNFPPYVFPDSCPFPSEYFRQFSLG